MAISSEWSLLSTWGPSLAGGVLIGLSATLWLGLMGRIAGISGFISSLWQREARGRALWFLGGLVLGARLAYWAGVATPSARTHFPTVLLALAGLLVGYGTTLARGCTSGHGVCGVARLSPRSLVATAIFLSSGVVSAVLVRHVWGIY